MDQLLVALKLKTRPLIFNERQAIDLALWLSVLRFQDCYCLVSVSVHNKPSQPVRIAGLTNAVPRPARGHHDG